MITQERKSSVGTHLETATVFDGLALVGLVMAVIFPIAGLPISIVARRRLEQAGRDCYVAKLGVQISCFLLILAALFAVGGLVIAVILPSLAS